MINFIAHEARVGQQGAREDFEQMLGLLVQATHGEAHLVFANPGDWGIDVLVGKLNGRVMIWQAKYFIREFKRSQKDQVEESFRSAMRNAERRGYAVDRWILCIPLSLDPPMTRWWQDWQAGCEREHPGLSVELWDENKLRSLLIRPAATDVRRAYYEFPTSSDVAREPLAPSTSWSTARAAPWQGGAECELDREVYLLHDPAREWASRDRSYFWREATAERIEPAPLRDRLMVRLRQVHLDRHTPAAEEQVTALQAQGALLAQLGGQAGLPQLLRQHISQNGITLVTAHPRGRSWNELLGPGPAPVATLTAAAALAAAADAAAALAVLHANGNSHRALHPGALFIDGPRCRLLDVGLTAIPPVIGEDRGVSNGMAVYQAPEQRISAHLAGPATDVYRLAAIVYHTITGYPPAPTHSPPARAAQPDIPEDADRILLRSLDGDPARRPDIGRLAAALRDGRRALSLGGGS